MAAGKCFRLFTAWAFHNEMEESTIPEVSCKGIEGSYMCHPPLHVHVAYMHCIHIHLFSLKGAHSSNLRTHVVYLL